MKTFSTILLLTVALFVTFAAQAAEAINSTSNSLELVLIDDHIVFTTATNISMEMKYADYIYWATRQDEA
ncbi:MAG: hypothetical protein ABSE16_13970 [Verrucomicrobiota bacterium]|jgi:hypothetical protein